MWTEHNGQTLEHNRAKIVAFPKSIMGKLWSIIYYTDTVLSFMGNLMLCAIDLNFEDEIGITYCRDSDNHKSWIDHVLVSQGTDHLNYILWI